MARVELPESRLRIKRRRRRIRIAIVSVAGAILIIAMLVGLTYLPFLQIKRIEVSGNKTLSSSTIIAYVQQRLDDKYAYVLPKTNIFLYPKHALNKELIEKYPVLASADVHAVDFSAIAVALVEREPRALWCEGGSCLFMDQNGVAYAYAPTFSEPIYVSYFGAISEGKLPKHYLAPGQFASLSALVDAIAQKLPGERITSVSVDAQNDVRVRFTSGVMLMFTLKDQGGDVFERLSLALGSDPIVSHQLSDFEYIDLRFGDKLYYKLR